MIKTMGYKERVFSKSALLFTTILSFCSAHGNPLGYRCEKEIDAIIQDKCGKSLSEILKTGSMIPGKKFENYKKTEHSIPIDLDSTVYNLRKPKLTEGNPPPVETFRINVFHFRADEDNQIVGVSCYYALGKQVLRSPMPGATPMLTEETEKERKISIKFPPSFYIKDGCAFKTTEQNNSPSKVPSKIFPRTPSKASSKVGT